MKTLMLLLLSVMMSKGCSQDIGDAKLEYTATTRGFFKKIIIQDKKMTYSADKNNPDNGETTTISENDWKMLVGYFEKIDLEKLPEYKDPTQKRFYDGAAIANLKITYDGKVYESKSFDHGYPPAEIEALVKKITDLAIKPE